VLHGRFTFAAAANIGRRRGEAHVKTCPDCNGEGVIEKGTDDEQQCPTCGGSGFVPDNDNDDEEVIRTASW
jgi:DnaJ-class molecular chaperone